MTARAVVKNAFADGSYELELEARAGCPGCRGVCMWRLLPTAQRMRFAPGPSVVAPGQRVSVSLPQRYVLLTSLMMYGVPLAGLLGGASIGFAVAGTDLGVLLGALGGIAISLAATPGLRQRLESATVRRLVVRPGP
jgi:sigma-E factor negative regulatory protein RseC